MKSRTKARSVALQVLYEVDIAGHSAGTVLASRLSENDLEENLSFFASQIVQGVIPLTQKLDEIIAKHAPEWPLDQIAVIDRNILRMALWEFGVAKTSPVKVVINESIELAKLYGSDSASRFVNGVLGALASKENEISQAFFTNNVNE